MAISSAVGMELQDPKMNGALPADALGYRQEREGFLPSHPPAPGRKPIEFMDFEGKTSFGMSVFNLSNAIMGSGILGLAYAMAHTGVLFFLALLLCIAFLSSYSIHLLLTCAGVVGIRAYEQLGQRALGPAGKVVVAAVICLHNVGAMSSYLFIIKSELPLVIGTFLDMDPEGGWFLKGNLLIIIVSVLIILPLALMRHLGYLGYTSGLSLTCMLFFLISVIYKKFQLDCPVGLNETEVESKNPTALPIQGLNRSCEAHMFTVDSQMFYTVPIMAFAFVCHPEVLPIYTELCRPSKHRMQAVANVSIGAMFCMYGLTATFGYLTFYRSTSAPSLIFILPSIFYLRIVPTEVEPLYSWPKIQALCFGLLGVLFMAISLGFMFANWATVQSPVSGH
ncbi:sodium-coupled neutral amino acid transporter 5 isoform X4 [Neofelis nebulosa]|uniref:sodium-coupled neutral amino acid transporter 5 isoform X4 n=1 Tax=Neofelis nebulosa TaxID=61452 RepID=UPI00272D3619|nr:sodium-coupled neutral amino acid transporter 5 isoform X4 [Neofelis nebulosa]